MKKHDFIQELSTALAPIDPQARAEIIADINDHFAEGAAHGQSEEEVCKNLGQPGQIAEQVLEEYSAYKAQNQGNYSKGLDDIVSSAMESVDIGGIISSALETAAKATRAASDAIARSNENTPRTVIWHNDMANQEAQWAPHAETDGATRIRGGYEIDIDKSFSNVTGIDIGLSISNVNLIPAQQTNDVRITIQGKSRHSNFELANKNGTLFIRQREPFFKFEIFGFKNTLEVNVYVPTGFAGDIKVATSVGNIAASGVGGNLKANTSAGDIKIDGHKANETHLRSSAGNISLTGSAVHNINAKSSAGNVIVESQEAASLNLGSSAGNVDVTVDRLSGDAELSTSAGTVRLKARDVQGNITAKSSAGSVHMYLPQDVNCRINAKKPSMGSLSNYLTGNPDSPYTLRVATSIGSIVLEPLASRQN